MVDSMWTWASMSPGSRVWPWQSKIVPACTSLHSSSARTARMWPSPTRTVLFSRISRPKTSTTLACTRAISQALRPMTMSTACCRFKAFKQGTSLFKGLGGIFWGQDPPPCQEVIPGKDVAPSLAGSPILGKQALSQTKLWAVPQKRLHASKDPRLLLVTGTGLARRFGRASPVQDCLPSFFVSCLPSRAKRAVSTAKRKVFASFGPPS